ncbi:hypothetical protein BC833DRAFT_574858 [Globomyces pollinis-pini]|nr:hypothetical protein BC833DRAFT_574858 [Globomyces pollinis-pini]
MGKLNLLHHKSWHVYNKDNRNRVIEDEKQAAEEELQAKLRITRADQEARLARLRSNANINDSDKPLTHVNLFVDDEKYQSSTLIDEKKIAQKAKEDKHTWFLGETQDGKKETPWYSTLDYGKQIRDKKIDPVKKKRFEKSDHKRKEREDPLKALQTYLSKGDQKVAKKQSSSTKSIEQLRQERIEREKLEKDRTNEAVNPGLKKRHEKDTKYFHSQFNPDFVRKRESRRH